MPLDIYLTATTDPHRRVQLFQAAVRKIHRNGGGVLHITCIVDLALSDTAILPSDVRLMFHAPAPKGGSDRVAEAD